MKGDETRDSIGGGVLTTGSETVGLWPRNRAMEITARAEPSKAVLKITTLSELETDKSPAMAPARITKAWRTKISVFKCDSCKNNKLTIEHDWTLGFGNENRSDTEKQTNHDEADKEAKDE